MQNMLETRSSVKPLAAPKTLRMHRLMGLTSMPAGKMVPVAAVPLLREDSVRSGKVRLSFEMMETAEILMNPVKVKVSAYLVPNLAFDRFDGMDSLNKSYEGVAGAGGAVDFFDTVAWGAHESNDIHTYMGLHSSSTNVNAAYVETYNQIWNLRAGNRSPNITKRLMTETALAPAFWDHSAFAHIVPDFDQAQIDGEVALTIQNQKMPITGLGVDDDFSQVTSEAVREAGAVQTTYANAKRIRNSSSDGNTLYIEQDPDNLGYPNIFAELQEDGITVSLSNIDLAKRTAAFAKLRARYADHDDDYIIDLLMKGIRIPDQAFKKPILLSQNETMFGLSKRYASDAANLTESVVNGATFVDLNLRVPPVTTGGVIMIVAEAYPEQLFERMQDPYLEITDPTDLPDYTRDTLDPEKVTVVQNAYVDTDHATPTDTFGYAHLNHQWNYVTPRIGGRFYRPEVDAAFDEDRQRIWAVETQDPTLSEDFYLTTGMHTKPFADSNVEPFEVAYQGNAMIEGLTVFGDQLIEASDDYATIAAKAPTTRIDKT